MQDVTNTLKFSMTSQPVIRRTFYFILSTGTHDFEFPRRMFLNKNVQGKAIFLKGFSFHFATVKN